MADGSEAKKSDNGWPDWLRDFLKPVNVVSIGLGILALATGFYFYRASLARPEISWVVSKQIVFDYHSAARAIHVLDEQGKPITSDLYAAQFTVWNSGNERFDNVDASTTIRQPLTFQLNGTGYIVSASITAAKNDTAGGWELTDSGDATRVMVWKHFDPGAAARILVVYAGNQDTEIQIAMTVAGSHVLNQGYTPNLVLLVYQRILVAIGAVCVGATGSLFLAYVITHGLPQSPIMPQSIGMNFLIMFLLFLIFSFIGGASEVLSRPPAVPLF